MTGTLTDLGVTVMATMTWPTPTRLQFSPQGVAFLADAIIIQRYLEMTVV